MTPCAMRLSFTERVRRPLAAAAPNHAGIWSGRMSLSENRFPLFRDMRYPPPNQLAPLRSRLRQASSATQLGTAPVFDAR